MNYEHPSTFLRSKAESQVLIETGQKPVTPVSKKDALHLLQELQVHQVELEMQNDELTRSQDLLLHERARFQQLFNLAPVGYFLLDEFGLILEVNDFGARLLMTTKRQLVDKRLQSLLCPGEEAAFYKFIMKMKASTEHAKGQVQLALMGGKTIWVMLEGATAANGPDVNAQFYVAVVDISEQKHAERQLQKAKTTLELALGASGMGTWEMDLTNGSVNLDAHSRAIYGLDSWEFKGSYHDFVHRVHPADRARMEQDLHRALHKKAELDIRYRILRGPEERWLISCGHVIEQGDSSRFVGTVTDITEKVRLEEEAQTLHEKHEKVLTATTVRAQETERKRLAESLHDSLSQLLYGIKIHIQQEPIDRSAIQNLLKQAIEESRNVSFQLTPAILNDLGLKSAISEMASRLSAANLAISYSVTGFEDRLTADDEINIYRMVQELVNNSLKHAEATRIRVTVNRKGNRVDVLVNDNGKGFDIDQETHGTGLISLRQRISIYSGKLIVTSGKKGTSVSLKLTVHKK